MKNITMKLLTILFGVCICSACSEKKLEKEQESSKINYQYNRKPTREDGGISTKKTERIAEDTIEVEPVSSK